MAGAGLLAGIAVVLAAAAAGTTANERTQLPGNAANADSVGKAVFLGKGNCAGCHGPDAKGTPLAPNLTDKEFLHIDGSLESIVKIVNEGVTKPKKANAQMPPKGGATLSDEEVAAVSRYVVSLIPK